MATAKETIEMALRGEGCLGKAHPDEPVFVLRAQDSLAADLVEKWAIQASVLVPAIGGEGTGHKVVDAQNTADLMRRWPIRKNPD